MLTKAPYVPSCVFISVLYLKGVPLFTVYGSAFFVVAISEEEHAGHNNRCDVLEEHLKSNTRGNRMLWNAHDRLKQIHALSIQGNYELRIDLEDFDNSTAYAQYGMFGVGLFSVDPDDDGYPLTVGDYSGNAGDALLKHNGMKFTTKDKDNDHSENNCASFYHGAWWYRNCHTSNLNGQYLRGQHTSYADGIEWSTWTGWQYSLKFSEMKIRPTRDESK
ncbi:unnamed protein product [Oncorhynchus mykiss]|uniref:Fibrinogen C-terminal domain-containing protein n=1 Tax=Oncorhynchus mykiss TaxID=8022 RepID=A0A060WKP1_ONCMY|nr:unnamed protein product [Oncorhynchus mykiss]